MANDSRVSSESNARLIAYLQRRHDDLRASDPEGWLAFMREQVSKLPGVRLLDDRRPPPTVEDGIEDEHHQQNPLPSDSVALLLPAESPIEDSEGRLSSGPPLQALPNGQAPPAPLSAPLLPAAPDGRPPPGPPNNPRPPAPPNGPPRASPAPPNGPPRASPTPPNSPPSPAPPNGQPSPTPQNGLSPPNPPAQPHISNLSRGQSSKRTQQAGDEADEQDGGEATSSKSGAKRGKPAHGSSGSNKKQRTEQGPEKGSKSSKELFVAADALRHLSEDIRVNGNVLMNVSHDSGIETAMEQLQRVAEALEAVRCTSSVGTMVLKLMSRIWSSGHWAGLKEKLLESGSIPSNVVGLGQKGPNDVGLARVRGWTETATALSDALQREAGGFNGTLARMEQWAAFARRYQALREALERAPLVIEWWAEKTNELRKEAALPPRNNSRSVVNDLNTCLVLATKDTSARYTASTLQTQIDYIRKMVNTGACLGLFEDYLGRGCLAVMFHNGKYSLLQAADRSRIELALNTLEEAQGSFNALRAVFGSLNTYCLDPLSSGTMPESPIPLLSTNFHRGLSTHYLRDIRLADLVDNLDEGQRAITAAQMKELENGEQAGGQTQAEEVDDNEPTMNKQPAFAMSDIDRFLAPGDPAREMLRRYEQGLRPRKADSDA